jgi:ferredoxin
MPTVSFRDREIDCEEGAVLRDVLLAAGESPHNGRAALLNCRGHGTCGTCAVEVVDEGGVGEGESGGDRAVGDPTRIERTRLSVPPHDPDDGLRLSCQTRVFGDVAVRKHPGFWGQHVGRGDGD